MPNITPISFIPTLLSTLALLLIAPTVNGQVVVRRRRTVGPIVAGCVVGSLFCLSILAMCCMIARRRHARAIRGYSIEDPNTPNTGSGPIDGGTRIIAVRTRPTFWGRRRGLFGGPRVVAMSSRGGATGPQQGQRGPASGDLPTKEIPDGKTTRPPPPYAGQIREEANDKEDTAVMHSIPNQPEEAHIKESEFIGGFRP